MTLELENQINKALDKKGKHTLKRFECSKCGQIYIYIVKSDLNNLKCISCDIDMNSEGEY